MVIFQISEIYKIGGRAMDYLTAVETAKKWNVSSRMIAYYCENGRIKGAVKKGKSWLVPASAEKPVDKRHFKKTVKTKDDRIEKGNEDLFTADDRESDFPSAVYHTKDVFRYLGFTRETLRYYEEIGLLNPKRSQGSQYREFDLYDMSRLMSIDFYKKRGFSPVEMKELLRETGTEGYDRLLEHQLDRLQEQIIRLQEMQEQLKETKDFCREAVYGEGKFEVRELKPYYVREAFPEVGSFEEYQKKVLRHLDPEREDILSNVVRAITFDDSGYKGSEMYVVKPAEKADNTGRGMFLEHGKCLHTTLLADNNDTSIPEKMFRSCHEWALRQQAAFRGMVYIFVRLVMLNERVDRHFYEVWIPLK